MSRSVRVHMAVAILVAVGLWQIASAGTVADKAFFGPLILAIPLILLRSFRRRRGDADTFSWRRRRFRFKR